MKIDLKLLKNLTIACKEVLKNIFTIKDIKMLYNNQHFKKIEFSTFNCFYLFEGKYLK